jgi:LCP family protein required for cell wall assembly
MVAVLVIAAGSMFGYAAWRFGQIKRVSVPTLIHPPKSEPPGSPFTVLVVGSDSRAALTAAGDQQQFNDKNNPVTGQRSDTIMLLHVDPKNTRASILSIPRDLWVQIPGKPFKQRINTTFDAGPDLLVQAIKDDLGIAVDHYVEVNFDSFRQVVNAVGGVKEYFPTPAHDAFSALNVANPGCVNMTGNQALAFVRSRHYQFFANGRWQFEAESDLARIRRQQSFIKKMLDKAQSTGLTDPLRLNGVIGAVTVNLTLDSGFSRSQLLSLAKRFHSINPSGLATATLPTTPAVIQSNDVLLLKQPDAQQVIAQFLGETQPAPASGPGGAVPTNVRPGNVRISVRNGSGRLGEASAVADQLRRRGFALTATGDADNHGYATTTIRYVPGAEDKARYVASLVHGAVQLQQDPNVYGADVVLITGQSYAGLGAAGGPASTVAAPSTTPTTPSTVAPAAPPTTQYEPPGTPPGFVAPPC